MRDPSCDVSPLSSAAPGARYLRQIRLPEVGIAGQNRLREGKVLVLGAGGLGSPVLQYLAAAGVGTIGIIDDDLVEETNLHRQVIHDADSVGVAKVESAAARIASQVGSEVQLRLHPYRLTGDNAAQIFGNYDLVIDGTDNFPTRYLVADVSAEMNIPVVWGSILGFNAQVSVFWKQPPAELGAACGITLRDVFPVPPEPGTVPSCAEAGVIGALCGQAGSVMAMEALKLLGRFGESLFGRILVMDTLRVSSQTIPLRPGGIATKLTFPMKEPADLTFVTGRQAREGDYCLVDVRELSEYAAGHAAGASVLPLSCITAQTAPMLVRELDGLRQGRPVAVYCQAGVRSRQAANLLLEAGATDIFLLKGDFPRWQTSGARIERGRGQMIGAGKNA